MKKKTRLFKTELNTIKTSACHYGFFGLFIEICYKVCYIENMKKRKIKFIPVLVLSDSTDTFVGKIIGLD